MREKEKEREIETRNFVLLESILVLHICVNEKEKAK